ncbi:MAG: TIGR02453 family protein [Pseudomonadota bacterium]
MADFATLIPTARKFYAALDTENTKDWWQANRGPYDDVLKPGALALLEEMSGPLSRICGTPVTTKLFRPHRDVRFSKDKRPYNTHLHMMWQITGDARQLPVFFFGVGIDYVTAGAGMMGFEKPVLEDWRKFVDLDTDRIMGIMAEIQAKGYRKRDPELKRVPSTYAKDHPGGELLKHKGLTVSGELPGDAADLVSALTAAFTDLWPVNALLLQVAES